MREADEIMLWRLVIQTALDTPVGERSACAIRNGPSYWVERPTLDTFIVEGVRSGERMRYALDAHPIPLDGPDPRDA